MVRQPDSSPSEGALKLYLISFCLDGTKYGTRLRAPDWQTAVRMARLWFDGLVEGEFIE